MSFNHRVDRLTPEQLLVLPPSKKQCSNSGGIPRGRCAAQAEYLTEYLYMNRNGVAVHVVRYYCPSCAAGFAFDHHLAIGQRILFKEWRP